jgi:hypothetical protein
MWGHQQCLESVQQDATTQCGHLECHDIETCVKCRQGYKALELFWQMQQETVWPDSVTFMGVLNGCASVIWTWRWQFVAMQVWWMMACTASESVAMADKGNRCEQTPGLKYNKVHTLVLDDQDHPQVTSIVQNWRDHCNAWKRGHTFDRTARRCHQRIFTHWSDLGLSYKLQDL